jgi:hypothetical protein
MLLDLERTKYTQLDFRIETDNICCFISLSGLQKGKVRLVRSRENFLDKKIQPP